MGKSVKWAFILVFTVAVLGTTIAAYAMQSKPVAGSSANAGASGQATAADQTAQLASQQKEIDRLLGEYQKNPQDLQTVIQLGNLYYDTQQFPQAVDYYGKALVLDPLNTDVRTDMGTAYFYQGLTKEAQDAFRKVIEIDPKKAQAHYNLGLSLSHGEGADTQAAIAEWKKVIELVPNTDIATSAQQLIDSFSKQQ
jgi:cytochrome c-type biogenesis protein CcmH/NrfG